MEYWLNSETYDHKFVALIGLLSKNIDIEKSKVFKYSKLEGDNMRTIAYTNPAFS